jgi:zinc protease
MSLFQRSAIFLLAATVSLPGIAAVDPSPASGPSQDTAAAMHHVAPKVPKLPYVTYTLPNGLQVILLEDHRLPLVAVNLWYHVGPVKERAGRTGFAHLFEHMMFEGSKNVGEKSHFKFLESAGASDINGTTDFDRTNYFETLPSNELDLALWLESDRMGFLLDTLDAKKLQNQRDVVRNERRQSVENQPYGLVDEAVYHELFPKSHPYYADVMGSHADVEAARLVDIRDFFKNYYTPNNSTLAIVGDFKDSDARAMVEKYFGPIPRGPEVPKVSIETPPITSQRRLTVTDNVELPKVIEAWLTPPAFSPDDADGDVAAHILGGGKASRLYHALVYDQQIAQSASCYHRSLALASTFTCEFLARPGVKPEQLEKAADTVIADFRKNGPTQEELDRARNMIESGQIMGLESVGDVADTLNFYNQYTGDPGYLPKEIARYEAATTGSVEQFADSQLGPQQSVVVYGIAGKKVVNDVPRSPDDTDMAVKIEPEYSAQFYASQAWRKTAPQPGPTPEFHLPEPEVFALKNGLQVYFVEQHYLPVMSASLVNLAGGISDPAKLPGVASFSNAMLTQGTTTRSATQIAEDSEQYGASIGKGAATETASIGISALSNNAAPALQLLSDVALHPAFEAKEVERLRRQRLTSLLQMKDEPTQIAFQIARKALYGPDNPLGHIALGDESSNKAITQQDLKIFYSSHYAPGGSLLVMVGDMDKHDARNLAEKYFGSWQAQSEPAPTALNPTVPTRRVLLVDNPGAPQTAIVAVGAGVPRSSPDYPAIQVMNSMLGGLFSSRINMNLREEHGYTYGAFSFYQYQRHTGMFLSGAEVRTDVTAPAVEQLYKELARIRTEPLSAAELKMSIDSNVRSLPGEFETGDEVAAAISEIWIYGLPKDYFEKLPAQLEGVTSAQAAEAATKYIHPENTFLILVGDKSKIELGVKALGLGPIEAWDTSANPVKK